MQTPIEQAIAEQDIEKIVALIAQDEDYEPLIDAIRAGELPQSIPLLDILSAKDSCGTSVIVDVLHSIFVEDDDELLVELVSRKEQLAEYLGEQLPESQNQDGDTIVHLVVRMAIQFEYTEFDQWYFKNDSKIARLFQSEKGLSETPINLFFLRRNKAGKTPLMLVCNQESDYVIDDEQEKTAYMIDRLKYFLYEARGIRELAKPVEEITLYEIFDVFYHEYEYGFNAEGGVERQDSCGNTALHYAVLSGCYDLVKLLLIAGPPTELQNNDGKTPLDLARENQLNDIRELLVAYARVKQSIDKMFDIRRKQFKFHYEHHGSFLEFAIRSQNETLINVLFEFLITPETLTERQVNELFSYDILALMRFNMPDDFFLAAMEKTKGQIVASYKEPITGRTLLQRCVLNSWYDKVHLLLNRACNDHWQQKNDSTIPTNELLNLIMTQKLKKPATFVNAVDTDGKSAFDDAVAMQSLTSVRLLLPHGVKLEKTKIKNYPASKIKVLCACLYLFKTNDIHFMLDYVVDAPVDDVVYFLNLLLGLFKIKHYHDHVRTLFDQHLTKQNLAVSKNIKKQTLAHILDDKIRQCQLKANALIRSIHHFDYLTNSLKALDNAKDSSGKTPSLLITRLSQYQQSQIALPALQRMGSISLTMIDETLMPLDREAKFEIVTELRAKKHLPELNQALIAIATEGVLLPSGNLQDINDIITCLNQASSIVRPHLVEAVRTALGTGGLDKFQTLLSGNFDCSDWSSMLLKSLANRLHIEYQHPTLVQATIFSGKIYWRVIQSGMVVYDHTAATDHPIDFSANKTWFMTWFQFQQFKNAGKRHGNVEITQQRFVNAMPSDCVQVAKEIWHELKKVGVLTDKNRLSVAWTLLSSYPLKLKSVNNPELYTKIYNALLSIVYDSRYTKAVSADFLPLHYRQDCNPKQWSKKANVTNNSGYRDQPYCTSLLHVATKNNLSNHRNTDMEVKEYGFVCEYDHIPSVAVLDSFAKEQLKLVEVDIGKCEQEIACAAQAELPKLQAQLVEYNSVKESITSEIGGAAWWAISMPGALHHQSDSYKVRLSEQEKTEFPMASSMQCYFNMLANQKDIYPELIENYLLLLGAFRFLYRSQVKSPSTINGRNQSGIVPHLFFQNPERRKRMDALLNDQIAKYIVEQEGLVSPIFNC